MVDNNIVCNNMDKLELIKDITNCVVDNLISTTDKGDCIVNTDNYFKDCQDSFKTLCVFKETVDSILEEKLKIRISNI